MSADVITPILPSTPPAANSGAVGGADAREDAGAFADLVASANGSATEASAPADTSATQTMQPTAARDAMLPAAASAIALQILPADDETAATLETAPGAQDVVDMPAPVLATMPGAEREAGENNVSAPSKNAPQTQGVKAKAAPVLSKNEPEACVTEGGDSVDGSDKPTLSSKAPLPAVDADESAAHQPETEDKNVSSDVALVLTQAQTAPDQPRAGTATSADAPLSAAQKSDSLPARGEPQADQSADAQPNGANPAADAPQASRTPHGAKLQAASATPSAAAEGPIAQPASADSALAQLPVTTASPIGATANAAPSHAAQLGVPAQAVAHEVMRRFDGGNTSFQLTLEPAELGRVNIRLDVSRDKRVTATISADNPATLIDLRNSARELQRALTDSGLDLADNGLSFSDYREGPQSDRTQMAPRGRENNIEDEASPAPRARPFGVERWGGARIDVWA